MQVSDRDTTELIQIFEMQAYLNLRTIVFSNSPELNNIFSEKIQLSITTKL